MTDTNLIPPEPGPSDADTTAADIASVFDLDLGHLAANEEPAVPPAAAPAAAGQEPGEGVVPSSPSPEPPAAPAAPTPPAEPAPAPAQPQADPNASPLAAPAAPSAPTAAPAPADPEAALRERSKDAQIAAMQAQIAELMKGKAPAAEPEPGTAPTVSEPSYALTIPAEVTSAIFGEDPATATHGLTHLVNSLAKHIHKTVAAEFTQKLNEFRGSLQTREVDAERTQQAREMQEAYYAKFPAHNKPVLLPIVQQEAGRLAVEYPNATVDDNWYNALGARVTAAVAAITGQPAEPAPTPAPTPAKKPAAMLPTGAPRSAPLVPGTEGDDVNSPDMILSTLAGD